MQIDRVADGRTPRRCPQHQPISALIRPIRTNSLLLCRSRTSPARNPLSPKSGAWTAAPPSAHRQSTELWTTDRQRQNPPSHRHRNPPPRTSNRPPPARCTAASLATSEQRPQRHRLRPSLRGETRDPSILPCIPNFFFAKASLDLTSPANKDNSQFFHPFPPSMHSSSHLQSQSRPAHSSSPRGIALSLWGDGSVAQELV
jgi:hypothetical protein